MPFNKIKKFLTITAVLLTAALFSVPPSHASTQKPDYRYTYTFGGAGVAINYGMTADPDGNIYVTGTFQGTVDFDPSGGTDDKTAVGNYDIFLTKINVDESYAHTYTFGGVNADSGTGVTTDSDGNVYLTGYYQGAVDFDPTAGTDSKNSGLNYDAFLTKIDADGTYGYTHTFSDVSENGGYGVTTDSDGNAYFAGSFAGTADFDPDGAGDVKITAGGHDAFLTKIDADGTYGSTRTFGGAGFDRAYGVTTDISGNVYLTGHFEGVADFDPDGAGDVKTSAGSVDIFLTKIDADGTYGSTRAFGGTQEDVGNAVTTDVNGNVYLTGYFSGTADFPVGGTDPKTSAGGYDIFLTKIDADGTYASTRTFGAAGYDYGNAVTTDGDGNVYFAGHFVGTADFDPTGGTDDQTAGGMDDAYLTRINADGSYGYTYIFGGDDPDYDDTFSEGGVAVDSNGIYIAGRFYGSADFDPTAGVDVRTDDLSAFLTKLVFPAPPSGGSKEGTINVVKMVINDNGGTKTVADFSLFVNGTPVASGVTNTFPAISGVYSVTETADPAYARTFSGDCDVNGQMNLTSGQNKSCIVTNDDIGAPMVVPPLIDIVKVPSPPALPDGPGPATYTYTLRNVGTVPVTDVTMIDDSCSPITPVSGDVNADAKLQVSETWTYRCSTTLSQTHTNTVVATGWANGLTATDIASATVVVGSPVVPPLIHVTKVPSPLTLLAGGGIVTYTEKVTNPGTVALSDVTLTDDTCAPMALISGDANGDAQLDTAETWTYTCRTNLSKTTTNTATASGTANGLTAKDSAIATVYVAAVIPPTPQSAACYLCDKLAYDVYIVNPDGSERHTGTPWVRVTDRGNGIRRYSFEDATLDPHDRNYDYNDVVVDVDFTDCRRVTFMFVSSNADWKHNIRFKVSLDDVTQSDALLVNDSKAVVGTSKTVDATAGIKVEPACPSWPSPSFSARLKGKILLQVQAHGEAWYVHPDSGLRYYMKDGSMAYSMMRNFGLGITDKDIAMIPSVETADALKLSTSACSSNSLANRVKGRILLQVQQHGEAWYVDVDTCRRIYMKDGAVAFTLMRLLGLGITDADLAKLGIGQ